jgi:hypothetical protein
MQAVNTHAILLRDLIDTIRLLTIAGRRCLTGLLIYHRA